MSTLKRTDQLLFERFLGMGSGYVCDLSDRTFADFVLESVNVDVYTPEYSDQGTSKAKQLRTFWKIESNYRAAKLMTDMLEYWKTQELTRGVGEPFNEALHSACLKVVARLEAEGPVEDLSVFSDNADDVNLEHLADAIQQSIEEGKPEVALDRLHTYTVKYIRARSEAHGLSYDRDVPLHALLGGYIRLLKTKNALQSEMAERIMMSSIKILETFNTVRNEQSLAHDNLLLNHNESMLIFRHVSNVLRFIESIEKGLEGGG